MLHSRLGAGLCAFAFGAEGMGKHQENVKHLETERGLSEEINRNHHSQMVAQEGGCAGIVKRTRRKPRSYLPEGMFANNASVGAFFRHRRRYRLTSTAI